MNKLLKAKKIFKSKKGVMIDVYFQFIITVIIILLVIGTVGLLFAKYQMNTISNDLATVAGETGRIGEPAGFSTNPTSERLSMLLENNPNVGNVDVEYKVKHSDGTTTSGNNINTIVKYNEPIQVLVKGKLHFRLSDWISFDLPVSSKSASIGQVLYEGDVYDES
ncbi:MAG: hypothetical protein LBD17_03100 [Endomicrobium sp.]|jgi:hypothetical protein|nr:hypothetical protein [Endomicrobium sp.]